MRGKAENAHPVKRHPTIAACGLDCGLCPRYYTAGKSRCPGCAGPGFFAKHPSCSFVTCCVRDRHLETCGECAEFPCPKFRSQAEYQATESSSYPPARKILPNQRFIRKNGLTRFLAQQAERMKLLALLLETYDDGRSRSFYCRMVSLGDPATIRRAIARAGSTIAREHVAKDDRRTRAKILKALLAGGTRA